MAVAGKEKPGERLKFNQAGKKEMKLDSLSGGVAPTVITATVRIIREVSATAVKALPVRP